MSFVAMHQFDCIHDAMAWACGTRFMTKTPMDGWRKELQAWREGDMVIIRLPHRDGSAIACVPWTAELDDIITHFDDEPALHEVTAVMGNALCWRAAITSSRCWGDEPKRQRRLLATFYCLLLEQLNNET
jgi:hypothetical protein